MSSSKQDLSASHEFSARCTEFLLSELFAADIMPKSYRLRLLRSITGILELSFKKKLIPSPLCAFRLLWRLERLLGITPIVKAHMRCRLCGGGKTNLGGECNPTPVEHIDRLLLFGGYARVLRQWALCGVFPPVEEVAGCFLELERLLVGEAPLTSTSSIPAPVTSYPAAGPSSSSAVPLNNKVGTKREERITLEESVGHVVVFNGSSRELADHKTSGSSSSVVTNPYEGDYFILNGILENALHVNESVLVNQQANPSSPVFAYPPTKYASHYPLSSTSAPSWTPKSSDHQQLTILSPRPIFSGGYQHTEARFAANNEEHEAFSPERRVSIPVSATSELLLAPQLVRPLGLGRTTWSEPAPFPSNWFDSSGDGASTSNSADAEAAAPVQPEGQEKWEVLLAPQKVNRLVHPESGEHSAVLSSVTEDFGVPKPYLRFATPDPYIRFNSFRRLHVQGWVQEVCEMMARRTGDGEKIKREI